MWQSPKTTQLKSMPNSEDYPISFTQGKLPFLFYKAYVTKYKNKAIKKEPKKLFF